jgi:DNA replication protein DnaC
MIDTVLCRDCRADFQYERPEGAPAGLLPSICPACAGKLAEQEDEEARKAARAERNVPPRYAESGFGTFKPTTPTQRAALVAVRDHARQGVFLLGPPGCGKTHLACAAIMAGPTGSLFVSTTDLLDDIRAGFEGDGHGLFERAKRAPLLALDDLGSEAVKDWVRDRLYTLLNWRWNQSMPVIATTNCRPKTISERIGEAGVSRLSGLCQHRIEMQGPDARRKLQVAS